MAAVECTEAYQRGQKHRKAKIKVGKLHVVECLLTGQIKDNSFPITRVRHGVHMRSFAFLNNVRPIYQPLVNKSFYQESKKH